MRCSSTHRSTSFSTSWFARCCTSSHIGTILHFIIGVHRSVNITMVFIGGIWWIFDDRLPVVINTGNSFLLPPTFKWCVPLHMKIKRSSGSPTVSVDLMLISMSLSSVTSPYVWFPPPVHRVHFGVLAFRWHITVKATLRGISQMHRAGLLPHQRFNSIGDILTPVCDRTLVTVIPSDILESL